MCAQNSTFEMDFAKSDKYMAFLAFNAAQFASPLGMFSHAFSRVM
jgi:hypothetical protein